MEKSILWRWKTTRCGDGAWKHHDNPLGWQQSPSLTCLVGEAGFVKLPHVELQPDDGKHHDGEEEEQPDLKQGHHRLHDGLEDNLQTCGAGRNR